MFVPIRSKDQATTTMEQTEQHMLKIKTRGAGLLTDVERKRLLDALNRLWVVDLKMLLSERSLPLAGNKENLIDWLITL